MAPGDLGTRCSEARSSGATPGEPSLRYSSSRSDCTRGDGVRVLIDSRLAPGVDGGVQQVIEGLASGFALSESTGAEFTFLTRGPWLEPAEGPVRVRYAAGRRSLLAQLTRGIPGARALRRRLTVPVRNAPVLGGCPVDDTEYDVVHLAIQHGFRPSRPYVYSPYDLQHLHFPEFFPAELREIRRVYEPLARHADAIVMHTPWNAADVADQFGLAPESIFCVPLGVEPPQSSDPVADRHLLAELGITHPDFALYPAQTWPHKNHIRLLQAIASLREAGISVPLVCTGARNEHYSTIAAEVDRLELSDLVHFTGFVPPDTLRAIYAGARCLVFPSLFEGWGMPIFDALARGLPVACTSSCGLGKLVGHAAVVFDPQSVDDIAGAVRAAWSDPPSRREQVAAGRQLTLELTWERTCRALEAIYRQVGGADPDRHDAAILREASAWRTAGQ